MLYCPNCKNKLEIDISQYFLISGFLYLQNKNNVLISALRLEVRDSNFKLEKINCLRCSEEIDVKDLVVLCYYCGKPTCIKNIFWHNSEYYCEECSKGFDVKSFDFSDINICIKE